MENDSYFLQLAIDMATDNVRSGNGGPFGALIVKNGSIVGRGVNSVTANHDPTAHAEVMAIRDACKNLHSFQLDGCVLYSSCEPCPMCLGAVYWARPDRLVFAASKDDAAKAGFDDSFIYQEIVVEVSQRQIPTSILNNEVTYLLPFEEWDKSPLKVRY